ncbi:MAG TPA: DNA repair protein RecN, partial [Firmicutes bacterium]|nr:DNA repair protein RecN [Bacillota bacterium]
ALYQKWLAIRQEQKRLASDERERNRRIDLLEFQIEEINGANLKIGEEEELSLKQSRLNNLDRLRRAVEYAHLTLAGSDEQEESIMLRLGRAEGELRRAAALDSSLEPLVESYVGASLQLEELNRELRGYLEGLAADPNLLQEVELRLDLIANLKRKYGATVKEIIEYGQSAEKELADLKNSEVRFDELESEAQRAAADWLAAAGGLSQARKKLGGELEKRIESELADLNMKNTKFSVQFSEQLNNEPRPGGLENVEFMISPNPGEELKPLAKIASGGELSRIMLALKAILAQAEGIPTVIFDEIDAGLGGRTAVNLGEKLYHLGNFRQVFCVTHLPVIAGYASNHYSVRKFTEEERTKVAAAFLAKEERVSELARMLGGEAGEDITYEHAQKLLGRAYGS